MFEKMIDSRFPKMVKVRQHFNTPEIADVNKIITTQIMQPKFSQCIRKGSRIAILVGSRGIGRIDEIVSAVVKNIKELGAEPFIIPAMGSHGGATAVGQKEVLKSLGITEESAGAPIISSMETVKLGVSSVGLPVYFDANAAKAD